MTWARFDTRHHANRKVAALTDHEYRVWSHVVCVCSENEDASVDEITRRVVPGLTPTLIKRLAEVGLLDRNGSAWSLHDFDKYQPAKDPTAVVRQRRRRTKGEP